MVKASLTELHDNRDVVQQICLLYDILDRGTVEKIDVTTQGENLRWTFTFRDGHEQNFLIPIEKLDNLHVEQAGPKLIIEWVSSGGTIRREIDLGVDLTSDQTIGGKKTFSTDIIGNLEGVASQAETARPDGPLDRRIGDLAAESVTGISAAESERGFTLRIRRRGAATLEVEVPVSTASCMHLTGDETAYGTKIFALPIRGSITGSAGTAAAAVPGGELDTTIRRLAAMDIAAGSTSGSGKSRILSLSRQGGGSIDIPLPDGSADTSGCMHLTGDETAAGKKTFSEQIAGKIDTAARADAADTAYAGGALAAELKSLADAVVDHMTITQEGTTHTLRLTCRDGTEMSVQLPAGGGGGGTEGCMHLTGDETAHGKKTFTSPITARLDGVATRAEVAAGAESGGALDTAISQLRAAQITSAASWAVEGGSKLELYRSGSDPISVVVPGSGGGGGTSGIANVGAIKTFSPDQGWYYVTAVPEDKAPGRLACSVSCMEGGSEIRFFYDAVIDYKIAWRIHEITQQQSEKIRLAWSETEKILLCWCHADLHYLCQSVYTVVDVPLVVPQVYYDAFVGSELPQGCVELRIYGGDDAREPRLRI